MTTENMTDLGNGYAIQATTSQYGGVRQRWLLVHSEKAEQRERKQLNKGVAKAAVQAEKAVKALNNQTFACEADAPQAVVKVTRKLTWH